MMLDNLYVPDCKLRLSLFGCTLFAVAKDQKRRWCWLVRIGPGSTTDIGWLFRFERL